MNTSFLALAALLACMGVMAWLVSKQAPSRTYTMAGQVPPEEFEAVKALVRCKCGAIEPLEDLPALGWRQLGPLDWEKPAHWSCPTCLRCRERTQWRDSE